MNGPYPDMSVYPEPVTDSIYETLTKGEQKEIRMYLSWRHDETLEDPLMKLPKWLYDLEIIRRIHEGEGDAS